MGFQSKGQLNTQSPVVSGSKAIFPIDKGFQYNALVLEMKADDVGAAVMVPEADWSTVIDKIRIRVNNEYTIEWEAADLVAYNKEHGHSHDDGFLPIFLKLPWLETPMGQDQTSYKLNGGVTTAAIEIDILPGLNAVEYLRVHYERESGIYPALYPVQSLRGQPKRWDQSSHLRVQRYDHAVGSAGQDDIVGKPAPGNYNAFEILMRTSVITDIVARSNGEFFHESTAELRDAEMNRVKKVPQTGYTHIDLCSSNRLSDTFGMLVTGSGLKITPTFTAAASFPIYCVAIFGPSGR